MKRLVLLGGGHAHVEVLRELAIHPDPNRSVTLVTPSQRLLYSGMVPGVIAGHYLLGECAIDLADLAQRANAELLLSTASLVSPGDNEVACADGTALPYDVLSIDVGAQAAVGQAQGVERHAILMRPLERALVAWDGVLQRARSGKVRSITLVGGGAAGIELSLAMRRRFNAESMPEIHVRVISEGPSAGIAQSAIRRLHQRMRSDGVELQAGMAVKEVGDGFVRLEGGLEFATDVVFWATGAAAQDWIRDSNLGTDKRGFMLTNLQMQSVRYANVFGAGDCATVEGNEMPKAGVFAVRAAPTLASNVRAALLGAPLAPHVPNPRFLALVSAGRKYAVGSWGELSFAGAWAWHWKDRIDRRFVERYREAPPATHKA